MCRVFHEFFMPWTTQRRTKMRGIASAVTNQRVRNSQRLGTRSRALGFLSVTSVCDQPPTLDPPHCAEAAGDQNDSFNLLLNAFGEYLKALLWRCDHHYKVRSDR